MYKGQSRRLKLQKITRETVEKFGWEILPHSANSLDSGPRSFKLLPFWCLEEPVRGRKYENQEWVVQKSRDGTEDN